MQSRGTRGVLGFAAATAILLSAHQARADAIDGNWCTAEGKRLAIEGPKIVTPAGTQTVGNYSRHAFTYEVPPADPGAGQTMFMVLLNENTMNSTMGADAQAARQVPVQVWHRCPPAVSLRDLLGSMS
jgi:hypothetical protein